VNADCACTGHRPNVPAVGSAPVPRRPVPLTTLHAPGAMVVSADHLASTAGLNIMAAGGNAADAAIATNAVLAVTAPHLCGMGGDLFALVHDPDAASPAALNASGRAGANADPARLRERGLSVMPYRGDIASVTVPGCVDGWCELHARFGRLPLADVLSPAVAYAERGFPASPLLVASVALWPAPPDDYRNLQSAGERVVRPGAGRALRTIARAGREGFYNGEFGEGLLTIGNGWFSTEDLATVQANWVEPAAVTAFGHRLSTIPPNSQGYLTLASAWIADGLALPDDPDDALWAHLLVEASRQAGHDRPDVLHEHADVAGLLDRATLESRRAAIDPDRASALPSPVAAGDTTYLCTVDSDAMAVSLIQSNAAGFGSWLVEPNTAINLHNRGVGFSLEAGHPAELGPGRRPPHTLSPALVHTPDGRLRAVIGTQGGDAQPQILLQLLARLLRHGESPAHAVAAPRWVLEGAGTGFDTWTSTAGPVVSVEEGASPAWIDGLRARGHTVVEGPAFLSRYGHANVITLGDDGMRAGVADPRARIGSAAGR
jgi:gamma-glutamyltranspeptidase / glutathione hydrolase